VTLGEGGTGFPLGEGRPGYVGSNKVTISVREGLLEPIFFVLRVRIFISVIGGGGDGGCGWAPVSDCNVGGGGRSLGRLSLVSVSFSPMLGEPYVSGLVVGLAGRGMCGKLPLLGEAEGD